MLYSATVVALVATISVAAPACAPPNANPSTARGAATVNPTNLQVTTLAAATVSGFDEPMEATIRDNAAFAESWKTLHSGIQGNPPPSVDFNTRTVIVVALGHRNTGGYSVQIDRVTRVRDGAVVSYTTTAPGNGCMTNQMVTSPVVIASVPMVSGNVEFKRHDVIGKC